mmetsp:Transcript_43856/g.139754  ORF Transcript_43856/g.139754 Transcript_43856/m.139754 type:complete len:211 (+) Transcript_43856:1283-1915(+)
MGAVGRGALDRQPGCDAERVREADEGPRESHKLHAPAQAPRALRRVRERAGGGQAAARRPRHLLDHRGLPVVQANPRAAFVRRPRGLAALRRRAPVARRARGRALQHLRPPAVPPAVPPRTLLQGRAGAAAVRHSAAAQPAVQAGAVVPRPGAQGGGVLLRRRPHGDRDEPPWPPPRAGGGEQPRAGGGRRPPHPQLRPRVRGRGPPLGA